MVQRQKDLLPAPPGRLLEFRNQPAPLRRQFNQDLPPVVGMVHAPDIPSLDQAFNDPGHRRHADLHIIGQRAHGWKPLRMDGHHHKKLGVREFLVGQETNMHTLDNVGHQLGD